MATASAPFAAADSADSIQSNGSEMALVRSSRVQPAPRRRGSAQQGRALETLGHAVEYLVDSRMFLVERSSAKAEQEAVQILMRMSRSVFSECPEVVTLWMRMGQFCRKSLKRR